jgi:uncharacterized repeat protein (TIGR01451 family)
VAGTTLTYTLGYANNGPSDAQDVYITDTLPISVSFAGVVGQPAGWSDPPAYDAGPPATLTWYTPTLMADTLGAIVFTVTVNRDAASGAVITNSVAIAGSTADTTPGNNDDDEPTAITTQADLDVSKSGNPLSLDAGTTLTYTLMYTNNGPSDAQDVTITDTLPVSITYEGVVQQPVGWSDPPIFSAGPPATLTWYTPSLAGGASGTIVLTVTVDSDASGWINNLVELASNTPDPTTPNTDTASTFVGAAADLAISKSSDPSTVVAGETLTYTLAYTNLGPSDAQSVYITDTLPADDVTFGGVVTAVPSITLTETSPLPTWYTPTLATGASGTIVFTVTVQADAFGTITNSVAITSGTVDVTIRNNDDAVPNIVLCRPDDYEEDDLATQGNSLAIGISQTHNFCRDFTDWITFTAQARGVYTITTSSWGRRADTYLALYALYTDTLTLLAANDDYEGTTDYSSRIVWQAPKDGSVYTYYLRITNRAGLIGHHTQYGLQVSEQGPEQFRYVYLPIVMRDYGGSGGSAGSDIGTLGVIYHSCPDASEPDDTWQMAITRPVTITAGVVQVHSFDSDPGNYAADKDFVGFDVSANKTITFSVGPVTNTQTLLELYDEVGNPLSVTGTTQLIWKPESSGHYLLSVSPQVGVLTYADCVSSEAGYHLLLSQEIGPGPLVLPIILKDY